MNVTRTADSAFTIQFESNEELREEHRTNLCAGGLRLPTAEPPSLHSNVVVTLRGPGGGEVTVRGSVVAPMPDGVALFIECDADDLLEALLDKPPIEAEEKLEAGESQPETAGPQTDDADTPARTQNVLDRIRGLTRTEKMFLAAKADRSERAFLVQDNDPQVLFSLLKNPRLTTEEVTRIAKSSFLTYHIAELIMNTGQWMANLEVRVALIHNPKTPSGFALRILPTLPEAEVRVIARSGMSMPLKQAALRRLQGLK